VIRIGIDVGGTNTDAVVMDGGAVRAGVKAPTTKDVMSGVVAALEKALAAADLAPNAVDVVMIGTTHFTNAVVQRRDLAPTAAVRLALPATASLPPMVDWPEDLRDAIGNHAYLAHGGNEFDGRVISKLDEALGGSPQISKPRASTRSPSPRSSAPSAPISSSAPR
jgi:N-methylhydantoinase A/oxoprolinase/acetone carboxylase beta subunit